MSGSANMYYYNYNHPKETILTPDLKVRDFIIYLWANVHTVLTRGFAKEKDKYCMPAPVYYGKRYKFVNT